MNFVKTPCGVAQLSKSNSDLTNPANLTPKKQEPVAFLEEKQLATYLAAQSEAINLAQDQAIESETIDEVIREQFSKQIAERVAQKKAALEKQRKG